MTVEKLATMRGDGAVGKPMDLNQAVLTQLSNIEKRSGKTLAELVELVRSSPMTKHGELVAMLKADLGLGHGDANTLVHYAKQSDGASQAAGKSDADVLDEIYVGPKAALRPIHERLMDAIEGFGEFEIAPKKGYVALRRKKQFAMLGPATNTRFELGLNMKGVPGTDRLLEQPAGGMCQYKVKLESADQVDDEVIGWVRQAFEAAE